MYVTARTRPYSFGELFRMERVALWRLLASFSESPSLLLRSVSVSDHPQILIVSR